MTKRMSNQSAIKLSKAWVEQVVVQHQLCPFAKHPFQNRQIRFVEVQEVDIVAIIDQFEKEVKILLAAKASEIETTLLIVSKALSNFLEYLDFLQYLESLIMENNWEGIIQVASFHPAYQFAGTEAEAAENYTNRSPFPMIHLLREESVEKAALSHPDIDSVPVRNIAYMEEKGRNYWVQILENLGKE